MICSFDVHCSYWLVQHDFHCFTSGNVFVYVHPVTWASWIMKEESSLFQWFNGSGPSNDLLTASKNVDTHSHIHVTTQHQIFESFFFFFLMESVHCVQSRAAKRDLTDEFVIKHITTVGLKYHWLLSAIYVHIVTAFVENAECVLYFKGCADMTVKKNSNAFAIMSKSVSLCFRQGLGSSYLPPGETAGQCEQLQPDSLYSSRGLYADELPSSARPRPVGGTTGTSGNCKRANSRRPVFMATNTTGFRCCADLPANYVHMSHFHFQFLQLDWSIERFHMKRQKDTSQQLTLYCLRVLRQFILDHFWMRATTLFLTQTHTSTP